MYESQLAQLTQQTFNMESASLATENLRNTMATVDAMKVANKELKKQYGKIDIDKIEVRHSTKGRSVHVAQQLGLCRVYTTRWRIYWSRRTRYRTRYLGRMRYPMKLTKQTSKRVSTASFQDAQYVIDLDHSELDALQFEEEEEGPSYLADLNKAPDFVDEAPMEQTEVCNEC